MVVTATMMAFAALAEAMEAEAAGGGAVEEMSVTAMLAECAASGVDTSKLTERAQIEQALLASRAARA